MTLASESFDRHIASFPTPYLVVYEYDEITPGLLGAPDREHAEESYKIACRSSATRVTMFKRRDLDFGFDEIKTTGKRK